MSSVEMSGDPEVARPAIPSPVFFSVSITKFLLLSLCTLGVYEIYWFYKNWHLVKKHEHTKILPIWRSLFSVFFCYALLLRIRGKAKDSRVASFAAGPLTAVWIIVRLLVELPGPYLLISILSPVVLIPVQHTVNKINAVQAPGHDRNRRFSSWNIATVTVGGIILVLMFIGEFLSYEHQGHH